MVVRPAPRVDTDALAAKLLEILGDVDAIELAIDGKPDSMFRLVCDSSGAEFVNHSVVDRYCDLLAPLLECYTHCPPRLACVVETFYTMAAQDSSLYGSPVNAGI